MLALVAEGRSNKGAGERLGVTERAVQKHVTSIFDKLGLPAGEDDNRRILAVLDVPATGRALAAWRFRHPATPADPHRGAAAWLGPCSWSPNQREPMPA